MKFFVTLDNPQAAYYAGQCVTGTVHLELETELKVRAISVRLRGFADVFFAETQASGSGSNPRTHSSHERYMDDRVLLYGKDQSQRQQETSLIPPGNYKFYFDFVLPKNLPSSYESAIGFVRYLIHATIERPWAFDRHEKKYFSVIEILDLNRLPLIESGTNASDNKTFCCLCCKSGPISASLSLKRRGYVPGETIVFDVKIQNNSSRTLKESRASLIMQVLYHTSSRTNSSQHVLAKIKRGQLEGRGQEVWKHERLKIPSVPPSYLKYCEIIDIQYFVELKLTPKGPGAPFKVQREVIVGTVPLKSTAEKYRPPGAGSITPSGKDYDASNVLFAECALGRVYGKRYLDKREISSEIDFVPVYGYFLADNRDSASIFTVTKQ